MEDISGAGAYMQYALIYVAMGMVVIGMAEAYRSGFCHVINLFLQYGTNIYNIVLLFCCNM